jgi:hypothetical protein
VSKTLGKGYFTLGKEHSSKISSAKGSLPSAFFGQRKTLGKLRIEKIKKKQQNIFQILGTTLQPYPILPLPVALSFFTIILNQTYMFCKW